MWQKRWKQLIPFDRVKTAHHEVCQKTRDFDEV